MRALKNNVVDFYCLPAASRALYGVMDLLVRTLRDIDPVAYAERVPAELVEQLDPVSREGPRSQTS